MKAKCTGPSTGLENCDIEAGVPMPPGPVVVVMSVGPLRSPLVPETSSSCHLREQCRAGQRSPMP